MSSKFLLLNTLCLFYTTLLGCGSTCEECESEKNIPLTYKMIINERAVGNGIHLVDEQNKWKSGELSFRPKQVWKPTFTWNEPLYIAIDLQTVHQVHSLSLYRVVDLLDRTDAEVSVYTGQPFKWETLLGKQAAKRNEWQYITFSPVKTRYLRLKIEGGKVNIGELFLFGTPTDEDVRKEVASRETSAKRMKRTTFDQMIGINAFIDDPIGRYDFFGLVREYHNWRWVEHEDDQPYPDNVNHWNPGDSKWNFDALYQNMHRLDIVGCPSIKENLKWLRKNHWEINTKPLLPEADPEDPRSYIAHADHLFQYAARYGRTKVADSLLKLADDQPRKSGLGYLRYFENWNEQNIWWKYRGEYFSPYEFAAMSSADYDGHQQALGTTVGLKNADTTAQLVMSGLASLNFDYVRAMKFWADHYRGGSFPADVLNFHHYSRYRDGDERYAISPEADSLQTKLATLVRHRDQYLPGRELWLTEFGYDTNPNSPQGVPTIKGFSSEEVQGMWLVRSLLAAAAAGIDRTAIYMLRDVADGDPSLYNTCGITSSKQSGWQPKPAWHYLKTLTETLKGMRFKRSIATNNPDVATYKFVQEDSSRPLKAAYVVWCATSENKVINKYSVSLVPEEKHYSVIKLSANSSDDWQTLPASSGEVTVSVSEIPTLILVSSEKLSRNELLLSERRLLKVSPEMVSYSSDHPQSGKLRSVNNKGLFDEQESVGNPLMNQGKKPVHPWKTPGLKPEDYPYSAYVDLGEETSISMVSVFDANNEGGMTISIGRPDNWQLLSVDQLMQYNRWSTHVVNAKTRFIRITKIGPTSNIGEFLIYSE